MMKTRVIPSLLIKNGGLVKTIKFKYPKYIGDPINAIKIFNDKEVDELVIIDIDATTRKTGPDFNMLSRINREAFMPLGYGGGLRNKDDVQKILSLGYEKVIIDSYAVENPDFIKQISDICGSQSIVICMDIKKDLFGRYHLYNYVRKEYYKIYPKDFVLKMQ